MKAITAVCANGASAPTITNGRISRHRDGENDEIQMYLSKLKDLVPNMPKNKKISKLEVIQNVIDYICDLQRALETTSNSSAISNFDASAVLCESLSPRQPLGVRSSPNTILLANSTSDTNTVRNLSITQNSNFSCMKSIPNNFLPHLKRLVNLKSPVFGSICIDQMADWVIVLLLFSQASISINL